MPGIAAEPAERSASDCGFIPFAVPSWRGRGVEIGSLRRWRRKPADDSSGHDLGQCAGDKEASIAIIPEPHIGSTRQQRLLVLPVAGAALVLRLPFCSHRLQIMKAITIREVDAQLARALEKEKKRRGVSLNQTVLQLLRHALGLDAPDTRSNSLAKLAGTWSEEDLSRFERDTAAFEQVDPEIWKR
jgi:hypothetical protein